MPKRLFAIAIMSTVVVCLLAAPPRLRAQTPLGTAFTYQGHLTDGGSPANGPYDFELKLYDALADGNQTGSTIAVEDQQVTNGLFNLLLDFGSGIFTGNALWLEIGVRPGDQTGTYEMLSPRQALTAVPYALHALTGGTEGSAWSLFGNVGTTASTNFLGTTDNQVLEIKVNSARALRIEPTATSPNLIGGYSGNSVAAGVYAATIGGGGFADYPNTVSGPYGTVSGGILNTASWSGATVGGGVGNEASKNNSTVGGGAENTASGFASTVKASI